MLCYILNKITHRPGTRYMDYMNDQIFALEEDGIKRDLDIGTCHLKIGDRKINAKPEEEISEDFYRKKFNECENKQSLIEKYSESDWLKKHIKNKMDFSFDAFFIFAKEALIRKRLANAFDNVFFYIPKTKAVLLGSARKQDRRLFHQGRVEEIIEECRADSLSIMKEYMDDYMDEELIANLGYNRM
jgi:hypothetical protein